MTSSSNNSVVIPQNSSVAFDVGTKIFVLQAGSGSTRIAADSGVTINNSFGLDLTDQWTLGTLVKLDTNEWVLMVDANSGGSGAVSAEWYRYWI
jgi:hypothetical protein